MIHKVIRSISFLRYVFFIALFSIIFLASYAYKHLSEGNEVSQKMMDTYEVSLELEQLISYMKDAETGHRGFMITKDSLFLTPYLTARNNVNSSFETLKKLTANNKNQEERLQKIYMLVEERFANFKTNSTISRSRKFKEGINEGKVLMDSIRYEVNLLLQDEKEKLELRNRQFYSNSEEAPLPLFAIFLVSILFLSLGYWAISKNYNAISKQNKKLKILDESNKQSEIMSNSSSWIWNLEENTLYFSDNLYRLLGCEPQEFEATNEMFLTFIHPEEQEKVQRITEDIQENEDLPTFSYRIIRKDGLIRHFKATGKLYTDFLGNKNIIGHTQDVTEDFLKTSIIEERNKALEKHVHELSEFNHVASHDLQEPLRKIQTFISRIDATEIEKLSENNQLYFSKIKQAAERMRILIQDLLEYSRTSRSNKNFETTDLNILYDHAISELSEIIEDSNAAIEVENLPKLAVIPFQIQQLFTNLISNAIKYAQKDKPPIIQIKATKTHSNQEPKLENTKPQTYIKLEFIDNGLGFEQTYAEKIFLLFNRLHSKNEFPGTGVGLAICKKIVENHNGFIFAQGVLGKGAVFTIFLPFKQ